MPLQAPCILQVLTRFAENHQIMTYNTATMVLELTFHRGFLGLLYCTFWQSGVSSGHNLSEKYNKVYFSFGNSGIDG